jgi:hypothetical protein
VVCVATGVVAGGAAVGESGGVSGAEFVCEPERAVAGVRGGEERLKAKAELIRKALRFNAFSVDQHD